MRLDFISPPAQAYGTPITQDDAPGDMNEAAVVSRLDRAPQNCPPDICGFKSRVFEEGGAEGTS